jgi:hypothetical protein
MSSGHVDYSQLTISSDVIDSFPDVDSFSDLPKEQLCSSDLVNKYAAMQQNSYGIYDEENCKPCCDTIVKGQCDGLTRVSSG